MVYLGKMYEIKRGANNIQQNERKSICKLKRLWWFKTLYQLQLWTLNEHKKVLLLCFYLFKNVFTNKKNRFLVSSERYFCVPLFITLKSPSSSMLCRLVRRKSQSSYPRSVIRIEIWKIFLRRLPLSRFLTKNSERH